LDWQNVRRDLRAACKKLKIPRCSPNDLRRTCATWLRAAGTPPHLFALLMGHADSRMVERVYGRLEPAALAQLIAKATGSTSAGSQQTGTDRLAFGGQDGQRAARKSTKLAPRAGFEPATHGLTGCVQNWPSPRKDDRNRVLRSSTAAHLQRQRGGAAWRSWVRCWFVRMEGKNHRFGTSALRMKPLGL